MSDYDTLKVLRRRVDSLDRITDGLKARLGVRDEDVQRLLMVADGIRVDVEALCGEAGFDEEE
jgi:hypothetical protein